LHLAAWFLAIAAHHLRQSARLAGNKIAARLANEITVDLNDFNP